MLHVPSTQMSIWLCDYLCSRVIGGATLPPPHSVSVPFIQNSEAEQQLWTGCIKGTTVNKRMWTELLYYDILFYNKRIIWPENAWLTDVVSPTNPMLNLNTNSTLEASTAGVHYTEVKIHHYCSFLQSSKTTKRSWQRIASQWIAGHLSLVANAREMFIGIICSLGMQDKKYDCERVQKDKE